MATCWHPTHQCYQNVGTRLNNVGTRLTNAGTRLCQMRESRRKARTRRTTQTQINMQPCNSSRAQLTNRHRHRPAPPRCPPCRPLGCRGRPKESPWAEGSAARNPSRADQQAPSLAYPSALNKESALPDPRRGTLKVAEAGAKLCAAAVGDATHRSRARAARSLGCSQTRPG